MILTNGLIVQMDHQLLVETSQEFTPTTNGEYAVIVTNNGCSDTSNCLTLTTVGI